MSHMEQVKASAGSGKTHDITQRFLAFLAQSSPEPYVPACTISSAPQSGTWGDIMAITFTNMAAAEMKSRVLESLKKCALTSASLPATSAPLLSAPQAKAWIDIILRQYGALNIRTIDSLLHLVVRTAALDLGLPPDFESSFHIQELMEPMFEELLAEAEKGDAVSLGHISAMCHSLVYHKDTLGFSIGERLLSTLLPVVEFLLNQDKAALQNLSSGQEVEARLRYLENTCLVQAKALCACIQEEELAVHKLAKECFMGSAAGIRKCYASAYYNKDSLEDCLNKASKGKASDKALGIFASLKEHANALVSEGDVLRSALQLYPFVEVGQVLAQKMLDFQRQESKVPAAKIPTLAQEILEGEHGISAALCRLGSGMQHVLVDEFQDTSAEQWQALRLLIHEALAQGGSLTWVGDVKQAIYGWRGGDADLFDAVEHDASLAALASTKKKNLPTNWRSREVVVQTNNALFSPLADINTATAVLEAMMSKNFPEAVLHKAAQKLCRAFEGAEQKVKPHAAGGYVCIEPVEAEKVEELAEEVRWHLQQKLQDLGQRRPWGDITILTRNNEAASKVAAWLLEWEIPAVTENSLLLQNHPLIREALALLSFLHTPQDDLSFWTVLTGHIVRPALRVSGGQEDVVNIRPSFEELHSWLLQARHNPRPVSLSYAFQKKWPEFWEHSFAPFYGAAQMRTPYDCMQEWFALWHVPQRFGHAEAFIRRFLEVLHSAERRGAGTLGTFLEYWEQSGGEEKTPTPPKIDAVRIMTIHKSKGLQFPVVIIPWLSFNAKPSSPLMVQKAGSFTVLAKRSKWSESIEESTSVVAEKVLGTAHYTAQAQDALESLNVFYVACTRAQEELYAFHTKSKYMSGANLAKGLTALFDTIGMELPFEAGYMIEKDSVLKVNSTEAKEVEPYCPLDFSTDPQPIMQWLPRLKIYRDPLQECFICQPENEVPSHALSPTRRGLLMHHCLEVWQSMGAKDDIYAAAKAAALWGIQSFALPLTQSTALQEEITEALVWYASLPGVQDWAQYAVPEQGMLDENGALYRADLVLAPQEQRGWRVVEFKTGQAHTSHVTQLKNYLRMLNAMPARDASLPSSQGVLIYLDLQQCRMVSEHNVSDLLHEPCWDAMQEGA